MSLDDGLLGSVAYVDNVGDHVPEVNDVVIIVRRPGGSNVGDGGQRVVFWGARE